MYFFANVHVHVYSQKFCGTQCLLIWQILRQRKDRPSYLYILINIQCTRTCTHCPKIKSTVFYLIILLITLSLLPSGVRLVELKILSVRAGAIQRPYDTTVRLLVEECVIVDTKQDYGPQYELIFCSNGQKLFTDTGPRKIEGDVFEYCPSSDGLIFMSLLVLSPLSPDHPTVLLPGGEGGAYTAYTDQNIVRKCNVHCTPVDIVGEFLCTVNCCSTWCIFMG